MFWHLKGNTTGFYFRPNYNRPIKLKADIQVIIYTPKKIMIKNCKYVRNNQSNFDALLGICVRASMCRGGGGVRLQVFLRTKRGLGQCLTHMQQSSHFSPVEHKAILLWHGKYKRHNEYKVKVFFLQGGGPYCTLINVTCDDNGHSQSALDFSILHFERGTCVPAKWCGHPGILKWYDSHAFIPVSHLFIVHQTGLWNWVIN